MKFVSENLNFLKFLKQFHFRSSSHALLLLLQLVNKKFKLLRKFIKISFKVSLIKLHHWLIQIQSRLFHKPFRTRTSTIHQSSDQQLLIINQFHLWLTTQFLRTTHMHRQLHITMDIMDIVDMDILL